MGKKKPTAVIEFYGIDPSLGTLSARFFEFMEMTKMTKAHWQIRGGTRMVIAKTAAIVNEIK